MRSRDILLIVIIIIVGLSIQGIVKLKEKTMPFFLDFGGKANYFTETKAVPLIKDSTIDIRNSHGDVLLIPWDKEEAKIELEKIIYMDDEEKAKELAELLVLKIDARDGITAVSTSRDELLLKEIIITTNLKIHLPGESSSKIWIQHGDLEMSDMQGDHFVELKHSNANIKDISGNVAVNIEHGDVQCESVINGSVDISAKHGNLECLNIDGDLHIETEHEDLMMNDVRKNCIIKAKHSKILASMISGDIEITAEHSGIDAKDITGNVTIKNSYQNITLANIKGSVNIISQHADIEAENIASNIDIESEYGMVDIGIPETLKFSVDCTAYSGNIESDFEQFIPFKEKMSDRITGKIEGSGPYYRIKTTYNDIVLHKMPDKKTSSD